jgi:2-polyprenyl-3-methyl-5-hydroxy-6-metoxy-1,4-benzoquinol methylase
MYIDRCFLCGDESTDLVHIGVRGGGANVLKCRTCGLIRLSDIPDDIDNYYKKSGMRDGKNIPLNELRREETDDSLRRFIFTKEIIEGKNVMDFGCGAGGYLEKAKTVAQNVYGVEIEEYVRQGLKSEGYNVVSSINKFDSKMDVITLFHVLEHLSNPIQKLREISEYLTNDGQIIIEVPNADDALLSLYECDKFADFTYWCCHIYLYSKETISRLIELAGLKVNYIRFVQRYPLSNHLYWLAKGKPNGQAKWKMFDGLDEQYADVLCKLGVADTLMCSVKK